MSSLKFLFFYILIATNIGAQVNIFNRQFLYKTKFASGEINQMKQTLDKGYVFCRGTGDSATGPVELYVEIVKINREGDKYWSRKILQGNLPARSSASTLTENNLGEILLGTSEYQSDSARIVLVNMDSTGNINWSRKYPGACNSIVCKIVPTSDNGYLLTGATVDSSHIGYPYVIKINSLGHLIWAKKIDSMGSLTGCFYSSVEIPGEGYLVAGCIDKKALVVKFDYSGNVVWNKKLFTNSGVFYNVDRQSDGSLILAGNYSDSINISSPRLCIVKLDASGSVLFEKAIQENPAPYYGSEGWDIRSLSNNEMIVVAYVSNPIPTTVLSKLDSNGNILWSKEYRSTFHSFSNTPSSIDLTKDGGFVLNTLGGTITNGQATFSSIILKMDNMGSVGCEGQSYPLQLKNLTYVPTSGINSTNCGTDVFYSPVTSSITVNDSILCENILDPNILGLKEHDNEYFDLIQSYPNPSSGLFSVCYILKKSVNQSQLKIFNSLGAVVYEMSLGSNFEGKHTINLDLKLSPGLYFYSIIIDGKRKTKNLIIE
jgi:hypothetical protein